MLVCTNSSCMYNDSIPQRNSVDSASYDPKINPKSKINMEDRGFGLKLLRSIPASAIGFLTYETVLLKLCLREVNSS